MGDFRYPKDRRCGDRHGLIRVVPRVACHAVDIIAARNGRCRLSLCDQERWVRRARFGDSLLSRERDDIPSGISNLRARPTRAREPHGDVRNSPSNIPRLPAAAGRTCWYYLAGRRGSACEIRAVLSKGARLHGWSVSGAPAAMAINERSGEGTSVRCESERVISTRCRHSDECSAYGRFRKFNGHPECTWPAWCGSEFGERQQATG
jgi:hypothetical protein